VTHAQIRYSDAVKSAFQSQGWALFPGYADAATLDRLRAEASALAETPGAHEICQYYLDRFADGRTRLARVEAISEVLPTLAVSGLISRMAEDARALLGGPVVLFKDKLNIRYPESPGYAPHQDAARWRNFADGFVSFGLFLSASNAARGGFLFADYDLAVGLQATRTGDFDPDTFGSLAQKELTAAAGDAVMIDGRTPHCTSANQTPERILHLLFTYARSDDDRLRAAYYADQAAAFDSVRAGNLYTFAAR